MRLPLISVVIPVYNASPYLNKCLESLSLQTLTDFEVLLVDDGSTDDSHVIASRWAAGDPRMRYFHQPNTGASAARNFGIDMATGTFLTFVDADDWLSLDYLNELAAPFVQHPDLGMSSCGYSEMSPYHENGRAFHHVPKSLADRPISYAEFATHLFSGVAGVLWGKLFITEIVVREEVRLDPVIRLSEDLVFVFNYLQKIQSCYFTSKPLYYYNRLHETGLSGRLSLSNLNDLEKMADHLRDIAANKGFEDIDKLLDARKKRVLLKIAADVAVSQPVSPAAKSLRKLVSIHPEMLEIVTTRAEHKIRLSLLKHSWWKLAVYFTKFVHILRNFRFWLRNKLK